MAEGLPAAKKARQLEPGADGAAGEVDSEVAAELAAVAEVAGSNRLHPHSSQAQGSRSSSVAARNTAAPCLAIVSTDGQCKRHAQLQTLI